MSEYIFSAGVMVAAFLAACAVAFAGIGSLQFTRKFPNGLLHLYFPAVILSNGLAIFLSTRNYAEFGEFMPITPTTPIAEWVIRLTSVIALVGAVDQVTRYFHRGTKINNARTFLAIVFILFWCTSIALPAFLSSHKVPFQLSWSYSLILGLGVIYLSTGGAHLSLQYCRNAIFIFCAVGLLLIPFRTDLVLFSGYTQGYLPGVPRFAGLAPHPIVMGMSAALGMWCLMAEPMASRALNRFCWAIGLTALFLAQSKTVWFSFLAALLVMRYYQRGLPKWGELTVSRHRPTYVLLGILVLLGITASTGYLLFGDLGTRVERFLSSDQGAQVLSLTGRDQIWAVALSEWAQSPIFGYGLPLFGPEHQAQIGMRYATSGHNQLIDSLGRTGLIGASATVLYALSLIWMGLRFARVSKGLSAALALSITVRMVTEVPITLSNIGMESLPYYVLLAVIAANFSQTNERGSLAYA